jgi:hypothetical protein
VFDIRNVLHPKEIAYYVAPPSPRLENGLQASDFAMSRPEFAPERREIWFTDGPTGFYVLRLDKSAWPAAASPRLTLVSSTSRAGRDTSRVRVLVTSDHEGEGPLPIAGATVTIDGHPVQTDSGGEATIVLRNPRSHHFRLVALKNGYRQGHLVSAIG